MTVFQSIDFDGHEQVVYVSNPRTGLRAIVSVHNTALGPAIGGCRMRSFENEQAALTDVLRLSKGMTYKAAVAGVPFGGGKMVVIADPHKDKTPELMASVGEAIERLGGRYITGEDVGTNVDDMLNIRKSTAYVMGMSEDQGGSGDPSPQTAQGVFVGIQSAVRHRLGKSSLDGVRVAVQGLGNVGRRLCVLLSEAGAELTIADVRRETVDSLARELNARITEPGLIHQADVDVFAPCALGAAVNDNTLPYITAKVIAGGANNQLADEKRHSLALKERGILFAPDYVINAGGMIQLASEYAGIDWEQVHRRVRGIGDTLTDIFERSSKDDVTPSESAYAFAQERLRHGAR